jgi:Holliday junction resolvase RusA-like endonuclease
MTIIGLPPRPTCEIRPHHPGFAGTPGYRLTFNHWPPTDNGQRDLGRGRFRPNPAVGRFKERVIWAARVIRAEAITGWVSLRFDHVFASLIHGDPSNYVKVTQDALQAAGLVENDRWCLVDGTTVHYPWDPLQDGIFRPEPWKIGMTVNITQADPKRHGTPRPKDWKPAEKWIDPAPANRR